MRAQAMSKRCGPKWNSGFSTPWNASHSPSTMPSWTSSRVGRGISAALSPARRASEMPSMPRMYSGGILSDEGPMKISHG